MEESVPNPRLFNPNTITSLTQSVLQDGRDPCLQFQSVLTLPNEPINASSISQETWHRNNNYPQMVNYTHLPYAQSYYPELGYHQCQLIDSSNAYSDNYSATIRNDHDSIYSQQTVDNCQKSSSSLEGNSIARQYYFNQHESHEQQSNNQNQGQGQDKYNPNQLALTAHRIQTSTNGLSTSTSTPNFLSGYLMSFAQNSNMQQNTSNPFTGNIRKRKQLPSAHASNYVEFPSMECHPPSSILPPYCFPQQQILRNTLSTPSASASASTSTSRSVPKNDTKVGSQPVYSTTIQAMQKGIRETMSTTVSCKIQTSQWEDFQIKVITPSVSAKLPVQTVLDEEKQRRKQLNNRKAASKCRRKKLEIIANLEERKGKLKEETCEMEKRRDEWVKRVRLLRKQVHEVLKTCSGCEMKLNMNQNQSS